MHYLAKRDCNEMGVIYNFRSTSGYINNDQMMRRGKEIIIVMSHMQQIVN